jgi:hypothetical protein
MMHKKQKRHFSQPLIFLVFYVGIHINACCFSDNSKNAKLELPRPILEDLRVESGKG